MNNSYWIGTAPFCGVNLMQCEETPGYVASGEGKCGDGSCCWTGNKYRCKFHEKKWKESALYKDIARNAEPDQDLTPSFEWFGEAPLCGATPCDAIMAGFVPVKASKCGDGSCCAHGEKWLGMKPLTKQHYDFLEKNKADCWKDKFTQRQAIIKGLEFGTSVMNAGSK